MFFKTMSYMICKRRNTVFRTDSKHKAFLPGDDFYERMPQQKHPVSFSCRWSLKSKRLNSLSLLWLVLSFHFYCRQKSAVLQKS